MKNLIVVGDSFCHIRGTDASDFRYPHCWPNRLAQALNLNLLGQGIPGAGWWPLKQVLKKFSPEQINNTEYMIFCHSDATRLLNCNLHQNHFNRYEPNPKDEEHLAVTLYYKYILDEDFADWAQQMWLQEISNTYADIKLIHLYSFPFIPQKITNFPNGISVFPSLAAISLNEFEFGLFDRKRAIFDKLADDTRANHLSDFNNDELARQLVEIIRGGYSDRQVNLDVNKFQTKTTKWFDLDFWELSI